MSEEEKKTHKKPRVGDGTPGPGRPKGTPNKLTQEFRKTVQDLLDSNRDNVELWLSQVATGSHGERPDPGKALDLMSKLAEYAAPKLARVEHTGADGGAIQVQAIERTIVDPAQ
jgi:hypothetical protein